MRCREAEICGETSASVVENTREKYCAGVRSGVAGRWQRRRKEAGGGADGAMRGAQAPPLKPTTAATSSFCRFVKTKAPLYLLAQQP